MSDELLMKYLRGEALPAEMEEVLDWVGESEKNAAELSFMRLTMVSAHLCDTKAAEEAPRRKSTQHRFLRLCTVFASAACLAAVAVTLWVKRNQDISVQSVCVPVGQQTKVDLSDGTVVWLNSNSSLTFSNLDNKKIRRVRLSGEGYFDVAKDESRPFIVETDGFAVKVTGTKFNVNTYGANKTVVLSEGSVSVSHGTETYNLVPGEMYYQNSEEGRGIMKVDSANYTSWTGGYLEFKAVSLDSVLEDLQNFFGKEFAYDRKAASVTTVSGKLELREGLECSLSGLQNSKVLSYEKIKEDQPVVIKIR